MFCSANDLASQKKWTLAFAKSKSRAPRVCNSKIGPTFHNVVTVAHLNCKLDLNKISRNSRNVEYNPRKCSALVMKLREPRSTALIFYTGKMVCLGAKTVEDAHVASRKYARLVQRVGYVVKFSNFKVHNMVATYSLGFHVRLRDLQTELGPSGSYDPELFTGVFYKMTNPAASMFILPYGDIIIFGAKDIKDIPVAFDNILPAIKKCAVRNKKKKIKKI